jgi:hypothetical protein
MLRPFRTFMPILLLLAIIPMAHAQNDQRCFPETGFCIAGRIREFWEQNGGLPVFGFPLGPQHEEVIEGHSLQVQWFERNRLELHPENQRPYDVLLGRLGVDRLEQTGRNWFTFEKSGNRQGCRYFTETDQSVCGNILAYWRSHGLELDGQPGKTEAESLALFGLPVSGEQVETLSDGQQYTVQWFERARFELHPELGPNVVLLGLLGSEVRAGGPATPPAATPTAEPPAPTPIPAPAIQPPEVLDQYRKKMPAGLWQVNKNGIQLSVTGFEYRDKLGRFYEAGKGFKYVVFALEVANTGYKTRYSDTFYANPTSFDLIDLDGQTHEIDTALFSLDSYFEGGTFYQGTKANGLMAYRIPANSAPAVLVYNSSERVDLDFRVAPK